MWATSANERAGSLCVVVGEEARGIWLFLFWTHPQAWARDGQDSQFPHLPFPPNPCGQATVGKNPLEEME